MEDVRGERLALVTVELGAVPTLLAARVAELLHVRHPDGLGLGADRIVLAATHTHAGPGNFMGGMFDRRASSVSGHDPALLDYLAEGIVAAIEAGHLDRAPATLAWGRTQAWGFTRNRSLAAFDANAPPPPFPWLPPADLPPTGRWVDPELLVVRVDHRTAEGGTRPRGALLLFPIHGTAVPSANTLYDADLHGIVARGLEQHMDAGDPTPRAVALFASSAAADLSPALPPSTRCPVARKRRGVPTPLAALLPNSSWGWVEPAADSSEVCLHEALREMEALGTRLAGEAAALWDRLEGEGRAVSLSRAWEVLDPATEEALCPRPEVGMATAGGVDDGITRLQGRMGIREGRTDPDRDDCQAPKVRFLGPLQGVVAPEEEFPGPAPFSVLRLGDLLLGTIPAEVSWTAGARMRGAMAERARARGIDARGIALLTLAGGYLYYTTTREEYGRQLYEGSSTLWGPGQAEAFRRKLEALVEALPPDGPSPPAAVPPVEVRIPRPSSLLPPSRAVEPRDPALTASCDAEGRLIARWIGLDPARQLPRPGPWVELFRAETGERVARDGDPAVEIRMGARRPDGREWILRYLPVEPGTLWSVRLAGGARVEHRCG